MHRPVLLNQVRLFFGDITDGIIIDGTLGMGGHSHAILSDTPDSVGVVGIDRDPSAVEQASGNLSAFKSRFTAIHGNYSNVDVWKSRLPSGLPVRGFLLDLGLSSVQLGTNGRGFSFRDEVSLDMRFDTTELTDNAADIVNTFSEKDLADLIFTWGEDRASRRIARAIVRRRQSMPFTNADELRRLIAGVSRTKTHIDPATRTFQALRIAVNRELDHVQKGLENAITLLSDKGRLAVITYHSLEDRIVKSVFRAFSRNCTCPSGLPVCRCSNRRMLQIVTRKPVVPDPDEIAGNPRARSAKLRCAVRCLNEGDTQ